MGAVGAVYVVRTSFLMPPTGGFKAIRFEKPTFRTQIIVKLQPCFIFVRWARCTLAEGIVNIIWHLAAIGKDGAAEGIAGGKLLVANGGPVKVDPMEFSRAYGWPHDLSDEEILTRLLALNGERAAGQEQRQAA